MEPIQSGEFQPRYPMANISSVMMSEATSNPSMSALGGYPGAFMMKLDHTIETLRSKGKSGALLLVSIDNLAMIVSGHGFALSEQVMHDIYGILKTAIAPNGYVERVQRDQFGIIIDNSTESALKELSDSLIEALHDYGFHANPTALHIMSSSVCISLPESANDAQSAMDHAYIGLHDTAAGHAFRMFNVPEEIAFDSRQQMGLANHLSKAIREDRLRMAYQPVICSKSGDVSHYEALLRVRGDDGRISSAGPLIPIAENMGMIDVIDHRTLKMVVDELRSDDHVILALNISNVTVRNADWLQHFHALMDETPEIASRLIVEITETAIEHDVSKTQSFIEAIQAHGAKVALDDFGTGYTSFRQLKHLSVDMIKIDGSFVKDLVENADNQLFVKTLLDFSNGFGLTSVAEFVENGEIAKLLMELGVEYMQGYYFGRPENHRTWLNDGEYSAS